MSKSWGTLNSRCGAEVCKAVLKAIEQDDALGLFALRSKVPDWNLEFDEESDFAFTPLCHAVANECWDVIEKLIELGANPNHELSNGGLIWNFVDWNGNDQMEMRLKALGADITQVSSTGESLLRCLVVSGCGTFRISQLIEAGAPANQISHSGRTLICEAVEYESPSALTALLDAGASLTFGSDHPHWQHPYIRFLNSDSHKRAAAVGEKLFEAGARISNCGLLPEGSSITDIMNMPAPHSFRAGFFEAYEAHLVMELALTPIEALAPHITTLAGARRTLLAHNVSADAAIALLSGLSSDGRTAVMDVLHSIDGESP